MVADMGYILMFAAGIDHQKEGILSPARNNQIVEHPALLIGQGCIGLLIDCQSFQINRHQFLKRQSSALAFYNNLPHMGDIK